MKVFVLGKPYSGKTPFSIEVAAACGWQHIEALNWLRCHFQSGEFALLLLDHELMNRIVVDELNRDPRACAHYVRSKLHARRTALVDGLFSFADFTEFFDPATDYVVEIEHAGSKAPLHSYELELDQIQAHVRKLADEGSFDRKRLLSYRFAQFRRDPKAPDSTTVTAGGAIECSSLSAAMAHFQAVAKESGLSE